MGKHILEDVLNLRMEATALCASRGKNKKTKYLLTLCTNLSVLTVAMQHSSFLRRVLVYMMACVQRYYLETLAMYEYIDIWMAKLASAGIPGPMSSPKPVNRRYIGTFVTDPIILHKLWMLGIPVWYLRPADRIPPNISILHLRCHQATQVVTADANPPYVTLYQGDAGPATSIAIQDVVAGGIMLGIDTRQDLCTLNPHVNPPTDATSIVEMVHEKPMYSECLVIVLNSDFDKLLRTRRFRCSKGFERYHWPNIC
jgi:hypothetical protein